ncbi:unnamed protein product [Euphydryas editha]|uniref:Uncharacterized protein n=1 Tax=Euphydryas editha TaxID=104508 RepID=A0AAU9V4N9_EUPED|nr:unnamed protein product [Euphydryas editha]
MRLVAGHKSDDSVRRASRGVYPYYVILFFTIFYCPPLHRWQPVVVAKKVKEKTFLICDRPVMIVNVQCDDCFREEDGAKLKEIADLALASRLQLAFFGEFVRWENVTSFLICDRPVMIVNVQCDDCFREEDGAKLKEIADLALASRLQLTFFGEFVRWENVRSLKNCESLLDQAIVTSVDAKVTGQSVVLCPGTIDKSHFNGHSGAIKSGLCHLAIPRGWSWGGPASPFCPIWVELKVPD